LVIKISCSGAIFKKGMNTVSDTRVKLFINKSLVITKDLSKAKTLLDKGKIARCCVNGKCKE